MHIATSHGPTKTVYTKPHWQHCFIPGTANGEKGLSQIEQRRLEQFPISEGETIGGVL
jgi:hypothetical protein